MGANIGIQVPFVTGRELISAFVPFVTGRELISAFKYHSSQEGSYYQHVSTIRHRKGANISMRVPFVTGKGANISMRVPFVAGRELISACEYHSSQGRELISAYE